MRNLLSLPHFYYHISYFKILNSLNFYGCRFFLSNMFRLIWQMTFFVCVARLCYFMLLNSFVLWWKMSGKNVEFWRSEWVKYRLHLGWIFLCMRIGSGWFDDVQISVGIINEQSSNPSWVCCIHFHGMNPPKKRKTRRRWTNRICGEPWSTVSDGT